MLPSAGTCICVAGVPETVVLKLYVNGPPVAGATGVQTTVPRNVPEAVPVNVTVAVFGPPILNVTTGVTLYPGDAGITAHFIVPAPVEPKLNTWVETPPPNACGAKMVVEPEAGVIAVTTVAAGVAAGQVTR